MTVTDAARRFARLIFTDVSPAVAHELGDIARDGFPADALGLPSTYEAAERLSLELDEIERHPGVPDSFREWVGEILAVTDPDDPASLDSAAEMIATRRELLA